jgi:hypothetical protein
MKSGRVKLAIGSFAIYLLSVVAAVVAYNAFDPLPLWLGGPLAAVAIGGLCVFVGSVVRSLRDTDTTGVEQEVAAQAAMSTCVVVVVAGFSWSLLEAFVGAPRPTAAWASAAVIVAFLVCWSTIQGQLGGGGSDAAGR